MKTRIFIIVFLLVFALSQPCFAAQGVSFTKSLEIDKAVNKLESRDLWTQKQGYLEVKKLGEITVPRLLKALKNKNVSFEATTLMCDLLGEWKAAEAVPELIVLLESASERVRAASCRALGKIGDPQAVLALSKTVTDDPSQGVRQACALALGEIGDKKAVPALINALRDDYRNVQISALHSLKKLTGENFDRSYGEWQNWYNNLSHGTPTTGSLL